MTMSSLASEFVDVGKHYYGRAYGITRVTIHHMAGVMGAAACARMHRDSGVDASANYYIGDDGTIVCGVAEEDAAWTSADWDNDNRAITMEVSNSYAGGDWPVSDAAWRSMIALCADICNRYGIEPTYTGGTGGSFTEHRMFAATGCPGEYIHSRMGQIVREVKAAMNGVGEWKQKDGKWWYKRADGSWPAFEWERIDDKWYLFDADGYMHVGWALWDGEWYYLQPQTNETGTAFGYMVTGWKDLKWSGGKNRFYFDKSGKMNRDDFKRVGSKWYAFDDDGCLIKDDARVTVNPKSGAITVA